MKPLITIAIGLTSIVALSAFHSIVYSSGIAGKVDSPGEGNCTQCHSGTVNSGSGSVNITAVPAFSSNTYVPGQTYAITVNVSQTNATLFGFGLEALDNSNANAGTLAITNAASTQLKTAGNGRTSVVHTMNGALANNSFSFTFNWTAPNSGNVTLYAAGMGSNKNGSNSGDNVYTKNMALSPNTSGIASATDNKSPLLIMPNPATDNITLKYNLLSEQKVSIAIYNLNGELVAELLNELQPAGNHKSEFKLPEHLSNGVYLVKMKQNDGERVQKLLVL